MVIEIWKEIKGYEHLYLISSLGRVQIRGLYKNPFTVIELADKFNVSRKLIDVIIKRERWKHI